jgi:pSer/pThr/pTyr-binding forkhead associated (FHA) protein/ribosomal protein L40E
MIVCPNCSHPNPEGATQCEACFTPLPIATSCPNCGAAVQTDATFCGQCGFNLKSSTELGGGIPIPKLVPDVPLLVVPEIIPDPLVSLEPVAGVPEMPPTIINPPSPDPLTAPVIPIPPTVTPVAETSNKTQLQIQTASFLHVQTGAKIELPNLTVIHLGKPNDQIPPDIDVSGFPESEIVSRVHADIRVEAGVYYLEDMGSSNGTYVNHNPLSPGNRHRLRPGDRISLGKGDKITFLFQFA